MDKNAEERYLYTVNPKRPIRFLAGEQMIPIIRTNKSLSLNLEQVKDALHSATVYRRFANEKRIERVTIGNVERLHHSKYMSEEEYAEYLTKNGEAEKEKRATIVEQSNNNAGGNSDNTNSSPYSEYTVLDCTNPGRNENNSSNNSKHSKKHKFNLDFGTEEQIEETTVENAQEQEESTISEPVEITVQTPSNNNEEDNRGKVINNAEEAAEYQPYNVFNN